MSNVIKFPKEVKRCASPKEAESYFPLLVEGKAKCISVVRNSKREWMVTIEYWRKSEMDIAVRNLRKEYKL
jgi:hypothetical protein